MKFNRLAKLETAAGADGPGNVQVIVDWKDDDEITAVYIVDGIEYSEHDFRRRWPGWKPGAGDVGVNWD